MVQGIDMVIRAGDEASKVFGNVERAIGRLKDTTRGLSYFVRAGAITYFVAGTIEAITALHKALRGGGSTLEVVDRSVSALVSAIPILNRMGGAIDDLTSEYTGLNAAVERLAKITAFTEGMNNINESLSRTLILLRNPSYRTEWEAYFKIQNKLKEIKKMEAIRPLGLNEKVWRRQIQDAKNELKKVWTLEQKQMRAEPVQKIIEQLQKQVDTYGMNAAEIAVYEASLTKANDAELRHIEILKKRFDWLEMNKKTLEENKEAVTKYADTITAFAESALEAIKTPQERVLDIINEARLAVEEGLLTEEQAAEYGEKVRKDIMGGKERPVSGLPAEESRFLTFAPGTRFNDMAKSTGDTAKNTSRMAKLIEGTNKQLVVLAEFWKTATIGTFQVTNFK
jgi:hypothetical protein